MIAAIISDIHGNLEALNAVWEDIEMEEIDQVYCCGDLINYGANSEEVVQFIKKKRIPTIMGNHEKAFFDDIELDKFNKEAKESMLVTRKMLSKDSEQFIKKLPINLSSENMLFVHGIPPRDYEGYIVYISDFEAKKILRNMQESVAFVGHTHLLGAHIYMDGIIQQEVIEKGLWELDPDSKYIINVGSVGQPRDGNSTAKYIIFDTERFVMDVRFIKYDLKLTQKKIYDSKLPKFNADRLAGFDM